MGYIKYQITIYTKEHKKILCAFLLGFLSLLSAYNNCPLTFNCIDDDFVPSQILYFLRLNFPSQKKSAQILLFHCSMRLFVSVFITTNAYLKKSFFVISHPKSVKYHMNSYKYTYTQQQKFCWLYYPFFYWKLSFFVSIDAFVYTQNKILNQQCWQTNNKVWQMIYFHTPVYKKKTLRINVFMKKSKNYTLAKKTYTMFQANNLASLSNFCFCSGGLLIFSCKLKPWYDRLIISARKTNCCSLNLLHPRN